MIKIESKYAYSLSFYLSKHLLQDITMKKDTLSTITKLYDSL